MRINFFYGIACMLFWTGVVFGAKGDNILEYSPHTVDVSSLKKAIEDLSRQYGGDYPLASQYLSSLEKLNAGNSSGELSRLAVEALVKNNPLLNRAPLLFVVRPQYALDHHNTETLFQPGEINELNYRPGGKIKLLEVSTGQVSDLHDPGPEGLSRDPEVHFSGKKVVFSSRKDGKDSYHIYEVNADGSGLRQLTSLKGVSDIDPLYLPNGDIVFSGSREPKFCMCNRHIMANLYRMEGDGANPRQIGKSTLFEGHSVLLPDGRILYDRWEYVDRNFADAQGLWTCNPDGTNHVIYWGNNTKSPGGVIDSRPIPGTQKVIAVMAACHDRPWGALAIIDRQKGLEGPEPVEKTWPADFRKHITINGPDDFDSPKRLVRNPYEDPYPLNDRFFLVSRVIDSKRFGEKTGIYLVDVFGNEILVYEEPGSGKGSYDPMPLGPCPKPSMRPDQTDLSKKTGTFFLQNVYEGTHMEGVAPGEVKYLRIVESPEKRTWTKLGWVGQGEQAPAQNWHSFENKRILGIVPVNEDGSACFEVPADKFVYFQALDKDKKMVQSMRSGTIIRPGERQSCIGCHDNRLSAPPAGMAFPCSNDKQPSGIRAEKSSGKLFSYAEQIQPIWNKNCLSCHDFEGKASGKLNLSGDLIMPFNVSYTELWNKGYTSCIGGGPSEIRPAKSWGSHRSRLLEVLEKGHNGIKLSAREKEAIITWLDINGVYYPSYDTSYPDGVFGRGPLTQREFNILNNLAGRKLPAGHNFRGNVNYSLTRPEKSPFVKNLPSEKKKQALALLKEANDRLKKNPRADMSRFVPSDKEQLGKYDRLEKKEKVVRKAMLEGKKIYDRDLEFIN